MLQIPSGPGALYGLMFLMACSMCAFVIRSNGTIGSGYVWSSGMKLLAGGGEKNVLARSALFHHWRWLQ